ncbi:MAG: transketolase [Spirochaetae bacterium HGW-Spirochaetae-3]|jgi:transketolase|nr:MAG: transketolase [Spirochaetae bacterium HGW-Spirochaetae-3]
MTKQESADIAAQAKQIRGKTIDAIGYLGVGHIGGALSIVELLAVLYHRHMRIDPNDPSWPERDRFVLSKGHAGPALYATLALKGFFPQEWLHTLNKGGTRLPSHCDRNLTPGIDMTTGSLGQGLSAACGIALAARIDGRESFTYAVIGDGESDEGQVWEAAMFAAHQRLGRLIAFTDYNKMQIDGKTNEILDLGRLEDKWAAFGWESARVDGHDIEAIDAAIGAAKVRADTAGARPTMIVLDTVKGKGAAFCEGSVGSHNMAFDYATALNAIAELG